MVYRCSLKFCEGKKQPGKVMIHGVPRVLDRIHKWRKAIQSFQPDFKFTSSTKICSLHFVESDYSISSCSKKKILKTTAVPSVFTKSTCTMLSSTSQMMPSISQNSLSLFEEPTSENEEQLQQTVRLEPLPAWGSSISPTLKLFVQNVPGFKDEESMDSTTSKRMLLNLREKYNKVPIFVNINKSPDVPIDFKTYNYKGLWIFRR